MIELAESRKTSLRDSHLGTTIPQRKAYFAMLENVFTYTDADLSVSEAEEVELIARAQLGDEAATMTLVHAYGPALRSAVSRFSRGSQARDLDVEDLHSVALIAFLETIQTHDPALNPRLAGRVAAHLGKRLADEFRQSAAFTIPERTLSRYYGILRSAEGDVDAAIASVGDFGMSREVFLQVHAAVKAHSLEERHDGGYDETPSGRTAHTYGDGWGERPVTSAAPVADVEDRILVEVAFAAVTDEEARICELAYGFTEYDPVADAEIAHRMGLTRPTVQRKRGKALGSMRKALGVTLDSHV